jgi:hypothetical protein
MLTIKLEGIISSVIYSVLVCQEICEYHHLSNDGAVFHDLLLDPNIILCEAVVDNFVELLILSAFIVLEVIIDIACALCGIVRKALIEDVALALAPVEGACDVAAIAVIVGTVACDNFLGGETHWLLHLLADAVGDGRGSH